MGERDVIKQPLQPVSHSKTHDIGTIHKNYYLVWFIYRVTQDSFRYSAHNKLFRSWQQQNVKVPRAEPFRYVSEREGPSVHVLRQHWNMMKD